MDLTIHATLNCGCERLDETGESVGSFYVETYADSTVNGDDEVSENFAVGDLTPGNYRVTFIARGLQTMDVVVYPGQLTLLVFDANEV